MTAQPNNRGFPNQSQLSERAGDEGPARKGLGFSQRQGSRHYPILGTAKCNSNRKINSLSPSFAALALIRVVWSWETLGLAALIALPLIS